MPDGVDHLEVGITWFAVLLAHYMMRNPCLARAARCHKARQDASQSCGEEGLQIVRRASYPGRAPVLVDLLKELAPQSAVLCVPLSGVGALAHSSIAGEFGVWARLHSRYHERHRLPTALHNDCRDCATAPGAWPSSRCALTDDGAEARTSNPYSLLTHPYSHIRRTLYSTRVGIP